MDISIFLAASATTTKAVDFLRNLVDPKGQAPKWLWNLAAFGIGIFAAWAGHINLVPADAQLGIFVTGVALGASASGFHEVFDFFSSSSKKA